MEKKKVKCELCGGFFEDGSGFGCHIRKTHNITTQSYYDAFLKKNGDGECENCGSQTSFWGLKRGYGRFCSQRCAATSESVREKLRQTNLSNRGVEYPFQCNAVKGKIKNTHLEKRGVEYPSQDKEIMSKMKQTNVERRGVEYPFQSEEVKEKIKQANLQKRGVENPFQCEEIKEKIKVVNMEKRGVENPSQCEKVAEKKRITNLVNRGVEYPMQCKKVLMKSQETCRDKYGTDMYSQSPEGREISRKHMLNGKAAYIRSFIKHPSKPQVELFKRVNELFPGVCMEYPCLNYSIDIVIPQLRIAIEYDCLYWHQDEEADRIRQEKIEREGYSFLRYRDYVPEIEELLADIMRVFQEKREFLYGKPILPIRGLEDKTSGSDSSMGRTM